MDNVSKKYIRKSLNKSQVELLNLVYKYRFSSRQLIATSLGIKPGNGLYDRLEVLIRLGYIGKRFDSKFRMLNVPAAYYLTARGYKKLASMAGHEAMTGADMRAIYNNKTVGQAFVNSSLTFYRLTQLLQHQLPGMKVFTERDMLQHSYFPPSRPDAFLSLPSSDPVRPHRFFFDIQQDRMPVSVLERKIAAYADFFEEGGWKPTRSEVPVILILCEWSAAERRTQRSLNALLMRLESDMRIYTATVNALQQSENNLAIWTPVDDPEELESLAAISITP